jgi:Skp family chaperone for outer membrane proteins
VRLARARDLLRDRLARRGLGLSSAVLAACLAEEKACASEVCLLAEAAVNAAVRWLAGPSVAGVSTRVIALTEGVVQEMVLRKWKAWAGVFLVVGLTFGGTGALGRRTVETPAAAADPPGAAREAGPLPAGGESLLAADPPARSTDREAGPPVAEPPPDAEAPPAAAPAALAPAPREGAPPLRTRIAVLNLARVFKRSKKCQALEANLRAKMTQAQRKVEALNKEVRRHQEVTDAPGTSADRREEHSWAITQLKRQIEDEQAHAKEMIERTNGETLAAMYREVAETARRVANARDFELVLFCNEAVTDADLTNPVNLQRKLSHGALMPMVVAPGMDITDAVTDALNQMDEASRPRH